MITGATGLLLAFSLASTRVMPGWGLNVVFWVHRIEALLAIAHVFIIHFFIGHLRRSHFPMDSAMFQGSAYLEATRQERPAWIARLTDAGRLKATLAYEAKPFLIAVYYVFGCTAMALGLFLLIGAAVNASRITW